MEEKRKQMFNFFVKKEKIPSDILLEEVVKLLFPPITTHTDKHGNKYHVDCSVDINLDAALADLEEGFNDETSRATIKKVSKRLFEIRELLKVEQELDSDAKYVLADDIEETEKIA